MQVFILVLNNHILSYFISMTRSLNGNSTREAEKCFHGLKLLAQLVVAVWCPLMEFTIILEQQKSLIVQRLQPEHHSDIETPWIFFFFKDCEAYIEVVTRCLSFSVEDQCVTLFNWSWKLLGIIAWVNMQEHKGSSEEGETVLRL